MKALPTLLFLQDLVLDDGDHKCVIAIKKQRYAANWRVRVCITLLLVRQAGRSFPDAAGSRVSCVGCAPGWSVRYDLAVRSLLRPLRAA